jgi:hypothetical protein
MMKTQTEQTEQLQTLLKTLNLPLQLFYTKAQAARIIGLSAVTLDRMKKAGVGMEYKKVVTGTGHNGRVMYPIDEIARFYFENVKTA